MECCDITFVRPNVEALSQDAADPAVRDGRVAAVRSFSAYLAAYGQYAGTPLLASEQCGALMSVSAFLKRT